MTRNQQEEIRNYADFLYGLSGNEMGFLASAIGLLLSQNLNPYQVNSLGNFLEAIGQLMLSIGSQEQLRRAEDSNSK